MDKDYGTHIQKILDKNFDASASASEKFKELASFLDKNLPPIKPMPRTMPYPPPMGYGSLGKDVTDAFLCETRMR